MKKAELLRLLVLQEELIKALQQRLRKLEATVAGIPAQPPYRPPQPQPWPDNGTAPRYPWSPPCVVTCDADGVATARY